MNKEEIIEMIRDDNTPKELIIAQFETAFKYQMDLQKNIDILHNNQNKLIDEIGEQDKEIERLKAREEEITKMYLAGHKYASEMEGKYILAKYVIDELEKDIKEDNQKAREYMKKVEQSGICQGDYPVHYYYADKRIGLTEKYLEKLKELKEGK